MSESEIARIRETIAKEYMAAKWGLTGFAQDVTKHAFISARMKRIEEGYKRLVTHVGNEAIALVAETLENVPAEPTREYIEKMLRHEFGATADTEYLITDLRHIWKSLDLLIACFGMKDAQKMINAPPDNASSR